MRKMCGRITLLRVDEMRELCWVTQEKDRCVVRNQVPVPFVGLELHAEAARVAGAVVGTGLAAYS